MTLVLPAESLGLNGWIMAMYLQGKQVTLCGCIGELYNKYSKCHNLLDGVAAFIYGDILAGCRLQIIERS